jgi:hypothetical protein
MTWYVTAAVDSSRSFRERWFLAKDKDLFFCSKVTRSIYRFKLRSLAFPPQTAGVRRWDTHYFQLRFFRPS